MLRKQSEWPSRRVKRLRSRVAAIALFCFLALGLGDFDASAGSSITLPYPANFGDFPASTYDADGVQVGSALLKLEKRADGLVAMSVTTEIDGGARSEVHAELAVLEGNSGLLLLRESSHSHNKAGESMGILRVDHVKREASCTPRPGSDLSASSVALPEGDRVINVPLQLLFLPLVQGETERISFQLFLCGGGARVVDFEATVAPRNSAGSSRDIIEVRYEPDLGPLMSFIAQVAVPDLAFWYDAEGNGTYLAHRMPLFSKGPEVMVVRDGVSREMLSE